MRAKPFLKRRERFLHIMDREDLDTFLVAVPENRYYLSGYEAEDLNLTESSGYLLITKNAKYLLTDPRYEEAARQEASEFDVCIYTQGVARILPEIFSELKTDRLGVEAHFLTCKLFGEIGEALGKARPASVVVKTEDLIEQLRVIKDESEVDRIRKSVGLTERAVHAAWNALSVGMTEKEIAWLIERTIREHGGQAVSFPPIVASGPNAALPHAVPTNRQVGRGDAVILDLGSKLDGYCSDLTRTWVAGEPDPRLREIYKIVREAQVAAQSAIRAGIESTEADAVARGVIGKAGYGEKFGHGLGHGVGLAVHEQPGLRKTKPVVLRENMIVTIEPGIYLPGFGGVRLENMARITSDGCELLTREELFYDW